jgi:hypothetical protein
MIRMLEQSVRLQVFVSPIAVKLKSLAEGRAGKRRNVDSRIRSKIGGNPGRSQTEILAAPGEVV